MLERPINRKPVYLYIHYKHPKPERKTSKFFDDSLTGIVIIKTNTPKVYNKPTRPAISRASYFQSSVHRFHFLVVF